MWRFGAARTIWLGILAVLTVFGGLGPAAAEENLKSLVQEAFALHQRGQFAGALPLLRRAYALDPNDYFVNLLLGIDSLRVGQADTAIPFLKRASRLRPKEEFPLDYLGEAYARQGDFGAAAEIYGKVVRLAPGSSDSAVTFVDFAVSRFSVMSGALRSTKKGLGAEYRLHAWATAESDYSRLPLLQRAADLDPSAPGIWAELASAAADSGDLAAAEGYSKRALQPDPGDLTAWIADAKIAARKGEWTRSTERLNAIAQRSPKTLSLAVGNWPAQLIPPSSLAVSGSVAEFFSCVRDRAEACHIDANDKPSPKPAAALFREQRWEQLSKLAPPKPGQVEAWLHRGIALGHLENCGAAIPALERGLSKSPSDVYGMFLLSWCYSREAGRTADQVQHSVSDDASVHVMRGDVLLRLQSKPDMAAAEYQLALNKAPNDPGIFERLAEAQFGAGKYDAARENGQAALKIDPLRLEAKRTLARIAMQERDYAAALPYLKELAAREPHDATARVELGKACAQSGALAEARENLEPALEHGYPDEKGSLHYLLGTVLKKMGLNTEADQAMATAAQLSEAFQQKSYHDQDPDAQP